MTTLHTSCVTRINNHRFSVLFVRQFFGAILDGVKVLRYPFWNTAKVIVIQIMSKMRRNSITKKIADKQQFLSAKLSMDRITAQFLATKNFYSDQEFSNIWLTSF